ncbi:MAG: hypothetical protein VX759_02795, partial [SAR324 cluster bacterium]|nr:hypothetical protein [SAR324 cluster bacterium]
MPQSYMKNLKKSNRFFNRKTLITLNSSDKLVFPFRRRILNSSKFFVFNLVNLIRGELMRSYFSLLIAGLMILGVSASIHAKPQGQLNLLYWQAPSTMNPNLSGGTKELEASSVVLEPLARYDEKGNMIPWL